MSSISRARTKHRSTTFTQEPYEAFLAHVERERAAATRVSYGRILKAFKVAHPIPSQVSAEQVRAWLQRPVDDARGHRPRAVSTRRTEHGCLRAFFRFLGSDVMAQVEQPAKPRRLRPRKLTRYEVDRLLESISTPQQRALVLLMADAGLRVSEACAVTPSRVVLQGRRRYLTVLGKGDVERLVPIGGRLATALAEQLARGKREGWHDETRPLVRTSSGAPYTRGVVWEMVAVAGVRAGIPDAHPHRLRHSWACWLFYERRVPLTMVSRLLGHGSVVVTQDYLGFRDEELFDALDWTQVV